MRGDVEGLTNEQLSAEISRVGEAWDQAIIAHRFDEGQREFGAAFHELLAEQNKRQRASAPQVVRLRFMAGEASRDLDRAAGEALGWRVDRDPWWNWHPGPVYDPPGDEWCIRKDARKDVPCNEALPHFTAEDFERALLTALNPSERGR